MRYPTLIMLQGRFPAYPRKWPELSDRGAPAQTEKEIMLIQAVRLPAKIGNLSKIAEVLFLNEAFQPLRFEAWAENGWQTIAPLKNITWHELNPCGSIRKKISMRQHPSSGQSFPSSLHLDLEDSFGVLRFEPAPTRTVSGKCSPKRALSLTSQRPDGSWPRHTSDMTSTRTRMELAVLILIANEPPMLAETVPFSARSHLY